MVRVMRTAMLLAILALIAILNVPTDGAQAKANTSTSVKVK